MANCASSDGVRRAMRLYGFGMKSSGIVAFRWTTTFGLASVEHLSGLACTKIFQMANACRVMPCNVMYVIILSELMYDETVLVHINLHSHVDVCSYVFTVIEVWLFNMYHEGVRCSYVIMYGARWLWYDTSSIVCRNMSWDYDSRLNQLFRIPGTPNRIMRLQKASVLSAINIGEARTLCSHPLDHHRLTCWPRHSRPVHRLRLHQVVGINKKCITIGHV
jgi:hypothetical protein